MSLGKQGKKGIYSKHGSFLPLFSELTWIQCLPKNIERMKCRKR
jgi:hypothetical protein